ncbi:DUF2202 domain-containing protein [Flavihumibacter cheonanensis]|uniref:DUF2202 domain-containing protein n=1 Tax=Flavihumibacter cheonanensis TaxID=1442385 RepID=UPI001EF9A682|nr:DUF2202 domain-containing protein [Flavihumibacter cheonanensis]MCG7753687.1 DUF2202 domain-containing protein [Flavihumibacter cheonanensis]
MKNSAKNIGKLFLLAVSLFLFSCTKEDVSDQVDNYTDNFNYTSLEAQIKSLPKEPLNTAELASLSFMREEEKLAKDVYISLYNKWGVKIFTNISASELTHMNTVLLLLNKYGLTDPVGSNPVGVFRDTSLQQLYNQLVAKGNTSILEAYIVGATIEDLDLFDLKNQLINIDNQDIRLVYEMLMKGSRNHLRSFYKNILKVGGSYTPQFISQAEFDAIVNSGMETGY